jgi:hypothetical protein
VSEEVLTSNADGWVCACVDGPTAAAAIVVDDADAAVVVEGEFDVAGSARMVMVNGDAYETKQSVKQ